MSADEDLAAYAKRLRGLKGLAPAAAKEAAPLVEAAIKKTAAAGTDIDGKPWPAKRDGTRALPNAASAISAVASGAAVIVSLIGNYVFHNTAKGPDRRRILPDSGAGIPPAIAAALQTATKQAFERLTK
jgi:hypothetical protein